MPGASWVDGHHWQCLFESHSSLLLAQSNTLVNTYQITKYYFLRRLLVRIGICIDTTGYHFVGLGTKHTRVYSCNLVLCRLDNNLFFRMRKTVQLFWQLWTLAHCSRNLTLHHFPGGLVVNTGQNDSSTAIIWAKTGSSRRDFIKKKLLTQKLDDLVK